MRIGESAAGAANASPISTLYEAISTQLPRTGDVFRGRSDLPQGSYELFPLSVSFPDTAVGTEVFKQGNMPVQMPVADREMSGTRMTFRVEVPPRGRLPVLVNLLECWRDLARIGRGYGSKSYNTVPDLPTARSQPVFRFDVAVTFLSGADTVAVTSVFENTSQTSTQLPLRDSYSVVLRKAWCASVLTSEISYEGSSQMVNVTAQIYCDYIDTAPAFSNYEDADLTQYLPIINTGLRVV